MIHHFLKHEIFLAKKQSNSIFIYLLVFFSPIYIIVFFYLFYAYRLHRSRKNFYQHFGNCATVKWTLLSCYELTTANIKIFCGPQFPTMLCLLVYCKLRYFNFEPSFKLRWCHGRGLFGSQIPVTTGGFRMQEICSSNPPVVTGIWDPNKLRARHHHSMLYILLSFILKWGKDCKKGLSIFIIVFTWIFFFFVSF